MRQLNTSRGLIKLFLLTLVTCGIYELFFIHSLAKDINEACKDDGKHTAGLIKFILLSCITCGIYSIFWWYASAERLAAYGRRNNVAGVEVDGAKFLLWYLVGALICGIGSLYAIHLYLKSTNAVCADYNAHAAASV